MTVCVNLLQTDFFILKIASDLHVYQMEMDWPNG